MAAKVRQHCYSCLRTTLATARGADIRAQSCWTGGGQDREHRSPATYSPTRQHTCARETALRDCHDPGTIHGVDREPSGIPPTTVPIHTQLLCPRLRRDRRRRGHVSQVLLPRLQEPAQRRGTCLAGVLQRYSGQALWAESDGAHGRRHDGDCCPAASEDLRPSENLLRPLG